jgi:hypothetical protein
MQGHLTMYTSSRYLAADKEKPDKAHPPTRHHAHHHSHIAVGGFKLASVSSTSSSDDEESSANVKSIIRHDTAGLADVFDHNVPAASSEDRATTTAPPPAPLALNGTRREARGPTHTRGGRSSSVSSSSIWSDDT